MELILSGRLPLGLPVNGKLYHDVQVKLLTMGAECDVQETLEAEKLTGEKLSPLQAQRVDLIYLAAQVKWVGVEREALRSGAYLQEHLTTEDYVHLLVLMNALRKKRSGDSAAQTDLAQPNTA